jgi:DNA-binding response OmpR family regulator
MVFFQSFVGNENQPPPSILVMEDELNVAKALEMVLTEEGYTVDLAQTGQAALETFNTKPIDLLIADLRLPDIDGTEIIRRVKVRFPELRIVVITGYASIDSVVETMKLGANDYLAKPFTEDQIKSSVDTALREKEAPAEADRRIAEPPGDSLIQKREVLSVLNRTAEDASFWTDLMENGSEALSSYRLSDEAKAAIVSGDLRWLNAHIGELTQKQLQFIYKRLEREAW